MRNSWLVGVAVAALCAGLSHAGTIRDDDSIVYRPTGKGVGEIDTSPGARERNELYRAWAARTGGSTTAMVYHGGPVMNDANGVNVYYIWYGNWTGNTAPSILGDLASNLTGPPYFNINTTYADGTGKAVVNRVNMLGS